MWFKFISYERRVVEMWAKSMEMVFFLDWRNYLIGWIAEEKTHKLVFGCMATHRFWVLSLSYFSFLLIYQYKPQVKRRWEEKESKAQANQCTNTSKFTREKTQNPKWMVCFVTCNYFLRSIFQFGINPCDKCCHGVLSIDTVDLYTMHTFSWRNVRSARSFELYECRRNGRKMDSLSIEINWIFNFMSKTNCGLSTKKKANITHAREYKSRIK